jgi:glycosyltransferase involved in cell wall biosynthesis
VIGSLGVGGTERHLAMVYAHLPVERFELAVFVLQRGGALEASVRASGVAVLGRVTNARGFVRAIGATVTLARTLHDWRPDIVHFFLPEAYLVGAPITLLCSGARRLMSRRSLRDYQRKYLGAALAERLLHRCMHAVTGNSRAVVRQLREEGVAAARLGLIYNGVVLPVLDPGLRKAKRAALAIGDRDVVMLVNANLIAYKGHADLLHALASIQANISSPWRVLCCGRDDGQGAHLARLADELGVARNITWLGLVDQPLALAAAADIGVQPSHQEGFSNAVLEGMAAGLAMVVTDVGGNGEAIDDGRCGRLVPCRAPALLGAALLELIESEDLREQFGRLARARVAEHFNLERCVAGYQSLYEWTASAGYDERVPATIAA